MKKLYLIIFSSLFSIICFSKSWDQKIEYFLIKVTNNGDFNGYDLADIDSVQFLNIKNCLQSSDNCYKLGSSLFTGGNGPSYHRIFDHELFGYFELSAKYPIDLLRLNSNSIELRFSGSKDCRLIDSEAYRITYSKNTFFTHCIDISNDVKLLVLISPTERDKKESLKVNITPLQNWVKEIVIKQHIDTLLTRHIPSDPAVMAFCSSSRINKESAVINDAIMLVNEGDTYLIIRANQIKQKANNPLTWIRGWDKCEILVDNGTIGRYSFSSTKISELDIWEKKDQNVETKDKTGAKISITIL